MVVFFVVLIILFSSSAVIREKKTGRTRVLRSESPPHVFVQPARSDSVRIFLDGKASLMNLQENGSLMIVENQKCQEGKATCYLLKSEEPYYFESTMLSQDKNGKISVHASRNEDRRVIVFRA